MPIPDPSAILAFNVKDFGALGDGSLDDAPSIQDAINAAVTSYTVGPAPYTASGPSIYFPPGIYRIDTTLSLGYNQMSISIIGDNAILVPHDRDLFTGYAMEHLWCYDVKIQGLNFLDFKKSLKLYNLDTVPVPPQYLDSSQMQISNCAFHRNDESISVDLLNSITEIESCKFTDNLVAVNIVTSEKTVIRNCWITPKAHMTGTHSATIINGGRLVMENCILVPLNQSTAVEPAWINNYNCVTVKDTRQGGEPHSMTLINNFAGVGNTVGWQTGDPDPCSIIVSDCFCYGTYNGPGTPSGYITPTVVRYVDKIPNMTSIENNCGMIYTRIIGFSANKYNSSSAIETMIAGSGAIVDASTVTVRIENNIGAILYDNGTHVPTELLPFVRSSDSFWPARKSYSLPLIGIPVISGSPDETITFKFEYPDDFIYSNTVFLINYSGCPLTSSTYYRGGYVGLLRANGFWSNPGNIGVARIALVLETLMNQIGDNDPASWPTGAFTVEAYWDQTSDPFLPSNSTNKIFYIKITGRSGAWNLGLDRLTVTQIDNIQY